MFQCDAFQLNAFQNDCAGGPALLVTPLARPAIGIPAGRVFTCAGRVGVSVGGAGTTEFQAAVPPASVHSFLGRATVRLGGDGASYGFTDPAAEIRRLDDEFLLMV